ncbi:hypothetical protein GY45DRAFT_323851 [Cubamyces sp. BRFM 1775]|nr:hypothetical protein GY45DRAFT_323851 [Cubamyces sp. BRFM 1775]
MGTTKLVALTLAAPLLTALYLPRDEASSRQDGDWQWPLLARNAASTAGACHQVRYRKVCRWVRAKAHTAGHRGDNGSAGHGNSVTQLKFGITPCRTVGLTMSLAGSRRAGVAQSSSAIQPYRQYGNVALRYDDPLRRGTSTGRRGTTLSGSCSRRLRGLQPAPRSWKAFSLFVLINPPPPAVRTAPDHIVLSFSLVRPGLWSRS